MKKLILTAFEPFGDNDINPTIDILNMVPDSIGHMTIIKKILPVVYSTCFDLLEPLIEAEQPDFVVCMGLAGGRSKISVERIAVNMKSAGIADNEGNLFKGELIHENGKVGYFTTLPYELLKSVNENVDYSYSAGTYICNNIFYLLMEYLEKTGSTAKGGFIHVPFTEHFAKQPYIPINLQGEIIIDMIKALGDYDG
ncbi:MAG: pyroglutamyl-peptidase I [Clostridia bacterium]|nr:pyroglutamyl-peptidase I [Clostridia bacterium]